MPTDSIRQSIFELIQTTLRAINGSAGGYFYTVDSDSVNIIYGSRDDRNYKDPYIYIYPAPEQYNNEKGEKGKLFKTLNVDLEIWVRAVQLSDMNENINKVLHDVEKALANMVDTSNLLIELRFGNNEAYIEELNDPHAGIIMRVEVDYETSFTNPSSS